MAKVNFDIDVRGEAKLKSLEHQMKSNDKATHQLKASTVALGVVFAQVATRAVTSVASIAKAGVSSGIEFNSSMETIKSGLIALSVATQDKTIPTMQRFALAQKEATLATQKLLEVNAKTPHNLKQTNEIYKAMYVSMKAAGASTNDIIHLTEKISIAAGAAGIEFNSLLAGVDGLATGTVLANSDLGRFLNSLGLTNKELKNSSNVVNLLNDKLKDFKAIDTYEVAISNLGNEWDKLAGKVSKDIFAGAKKAMNEISIAMNNLSDKDMKELERSFTDLAIVMIKVSGEVLKAIGGTTHFLQGVEVLLENAYLQASNMFSWTDELQKRVEDNREAYMKFGRTLETVDKTTDKVIKTILNAIETSRNSKKEVISKTEATKILDNHTKKVTKSIIDNTKAEKAQKEAIKEANKERTKSIKGMEQYQSAMSKFSSPQDQFMTNLGNDIASMGNNNVSQEQLLTYYNKSIKENSKNTKAVVENTQEQKANNDILKTQHYETIGLYSGDKSKTGIESIGALQRNEIYKQAGVGILGLEAIFESTQNRIKQLGDAAAYSQMQFTVSAHQLGTTEAERQALAEKENEARRKQIDALTKSISTLESISNGLTTDWYAKARSSLFKSTKFGLSFSEAKQNASDAWDTFQTDTTNKSFLDTYNKRMDELIGTLDEFKEWSKFSSKAQQEFEKHKALRDVGNFQQAQDNTQSDIDRQIAELQAIKQATEIQANKKDEQFNVNTSHTGQVGYATSIKKIGEEWGITGETGGVLQYGIRDVKGVVTEPTFGTVANAGVQQGFMRGGYTGDGGIANVGGVVHGQEYVLNAKTTSELGLNGSSSIFKEMVVLLYEQLKTNKKQLNIEKQIHKLQLGAA